MVSQQITFTSEDRALLKQLVRSVRFFSVAYIVLWILMCAILFSILWAIGAR